MKRLLAVAAVLIAGGVAAVTIGDDRPLTCERWKTEWNAIADRFDATYVEFTSFVRSSPEPGLEGARPIYAYARTMDMVITEASELPEAPSGLSAAREFGLESLRLVTAGVRSVGEGVESGDQERVEWGSSLIEQGRALSADAGQASSCEDSP